VASVLDNQLGRTKFIAGNEVTIADVAIMALMLARKAGGLPLELQSNVGRWAEEMEALPSWQKTQVAVDEA
jgi:glutathione S-transferase